MSTSSQMLWCIAFILALNCLVQCAEISPPRTDTGKSPTTESEEKMPNTVSRQTRPEPQTIKTTSKNSPQKPVTPAPVNEFALNDILFRGRKSSKKVFLCFTLSFCYLNRPTSCLERSGGSHKK